MSDEFQRITTADLLIGPRQRASSLAARGPAQATQHTTPSAAAVASETRCERCDNVGWYLLKVDYGHPQWGVPQPCECTLAQRSEQMQRRHAQMLDTLSSELGGELARCSFDNYDVERAAGFADVPAEAARQSLSQALATCKAYAENPIGWLYLWGPTGVGKSHLAAAAARQIAAQYLATVSYASEPALMRFLRESFDRREPNPDDDRPIGTLDERMRALQSCDLLVLDDVGAAYRKKRDGTDWCDAQLDDLLMVRYQHHRLTIITSNLDVDDLAMRVRSRIKGRTNSGYAGREQLLLVLNADQREG